MFWAFGVLRGLGGFGGSRFFWFSDDFGPCFKL